MMFINKILPAALLALSVIPPVAATTYTIRPDGTGDYPTIQDAINAVYPGHVIELADGTFVGEGNRDLDFLGKSITVRSESGVPEACVIDCQGSASDPHRGFLFGTGETADAVLEGISVIKGYALGDGPQENCGGGILCRNGSSPTLRGLVLRQNQAPHSHGGALASYESAPTVTDCIFRENTALADGGMYCHDGQATVSQVTFEGNQCIAFGGGMSCSGDIVACLTDVRFQNNTTTNGYGGGLAVHDGSVSISTCWFQGNVGYTGGGLACNGGTVVIRECTFIENEAETVGAALHASHPFTQTHVEQCTFVKGSASSGGMIWSAFEAQVLLENCIIAFSSLGQAVTCEEGGSVMLACCDIYGNEGGDYVDCIAGQWGIDGNISADPLFLDLPGDDLHLQCNSPCAPFTPPNPDCDRIGAWPVFGFTPVTRTTWQGIKRRFLD